MASRKTKQPKAVKKSAEKSAGGRPFKRGKDPRRGRGPRKGAPNAGRPPLEFKQFMQSLADGADARAGMKRFLKSKRASEFFAALKHVTEHGYGKPAQDITSAGQPLIPSRIKVELVKPGE